MHGVAAARLGAGAMMIAWVCAAAQTPVFKPGAAEDLRAVYATSSDIAEGRRVAESSCARCHGMNGISTAKGTPHIAGQRAGYIHLQLRAYQKRPKGAMESAVRFLRDDALVAVAAYYASQEPARPATGPAKPPPDSDPLTVAKQLSASCTGCHGESGVSSIPGTPSLAGQDAQYLAEATLAYKTGARRDETMKAPAAALDERAVKDLAAFYAAQEPQAPDVRKPLTLGEWTQRCDRCHGPNGNSIEPLMPALAAQRTDWLESVLDAYRKGARKSSAMSAMSASLSDADVKALAAHYSRQPARPVVYVLIPGKRP